MSVANRAARGALWTVASSMGGRAIGVLGTLIMTRFLTPDQIGEVSDATILCMTANWASIWGFGQYTIVKGRGDVAAEVRWHAFVLYVGLGAISLGLIALVGGRITPHFDAPHAAAYIPGMALAMFIRRIGGVSERVLLQQMQFRASGMANAFGEVAYTLSALALAALGHGGMSIVYANILQSTVMMAILVHAAGWSWLVPQRLKRARLLDMIRFGVPLCVQGTAHQASRYWDNLMISRLFGPGTTGAYNMAYNLADIPAIQVGEQIALVLMPSIAELPRDKRPAAIVRSSALLSLIIFPLAVGLGLVAKPLIALLLPSDKWQEVAPLLMVLACLSVFRPITWVLSAYLEAESKTNRLMVLEIVKLAILLIGMYLLRPFGLRVTAGAVGLAFGTTALASVAIVARDGISPIRLAVGFAQPLAACVVMTAAVWLVHRGLVIVDLDHPVIMLPVEIVVGAVAYVAAALVLCRATARDLLGLLKQALRRR